MAAQLWQLYDSQGKPIPGQGARKHEVAVKALLHASAHVWVWRHNRRSVEVLVQKRAEYKVNWPSYYDKSAGGHILLGETPVQAGVRKAQEELGMAIDPAELRLAGVTYWRATIGDTGLVDHEYQWVYLTRFNGLDFMVDPNEVDAVEWKSAADLRHDMENSLSPNRFVPYGDAYYMMLGQAMRDLKEPVSARPIEKKAVL